MKQAKPCIIGVVSEGTLKTDDLADAFYSTAKALFEQYGHSEACPEMTFQRLEDIEREIAALKVYDSEDQLSDVLEELDNYINSILPEGYEFGAQEGDGACFGIWQTEDGDGNGTGPDRYPRNGGR